MELNQLRYFKVVAKAESITKAAAELFITQSALSRVILRLESELGVRLFDRQPSKITLNETGRTFLEYVEAALAKLDQGVSIISQRSSSRGITVTSLLIVDVLRHLSEKCQAKFPNLTFDFTNVYPVNTDCGEIAAPDILLTPSRDSGALECFREFKEYWCVISNSKFPLESSGSSRITLKQLSQSPIALFDSPCDRPFVEDVFKKARLRPKITFVSDVSESAALINKCKCVGFVPVGIYKSIKTHISDMPINAFWIDDVPCCRSIYLCRNAAAFHTQAEVDAINYIEEQIAAAMEAIELYTDSQFALD